MPTTVAEQWKEINTSARHWETLAFETAKGYFTVVALAIGAAGAAIAWTNVPGTLQRFAVAAFLGAAIAFSFTAIVALRSQRAYLAGFYARQDELEKLEQGLRLRSEAPGSGYTFTAMMGGFWIAIAISSILLAALPWASREPILRGARLFGADLSAVHSLSQQDFEGACGDSTTKLPVGLTLTQCR